MKTFAFKNSQKYWSTRYSFSPRNYSRLDRDMFTSHPQGSDAIYIHGPKATSDKNTYYGNKTSSSVKFTFNNDPSQNKIYKNLSLEGSFNDKNFVGTFKANDSTDPGQSRVSSVRGWKEKGAHLHANIARSPNSGRANIVPVGVVRRVHQAFFPEFTSALGAMWSDTGRTQSEWLNNDSISRVLAVDGDGPNGLAAILPYGLDKAYMVNSSLLSSDPDALDPESSKYLFMEIDFFPGYKDSSGSAKYIFAASDSFDPSTIYGVPYDSVEAMFQSDIGLCAFAKNKATGNFKKRSYTPSNYGGEGFTFDPSFPYSIDFQPTKEGLFVYYNGPIGGDEEPGGGGDDPNTETEFTCADISISIADGTVGQPVIATSTGAAIVSIVPAEYVAGTASYTINFNVPGGYTNTGEALSCTANGVGNEQVDDPDDSGGNGGTDGGGDTGVLPTFTCDDAGFVVEGGDLGLLEDQPINYTLQQGFIIGDIPVYSASSLNQTFSVSIAVPEGYANYNGGEGFVLCSYSVTLTLESDLEATGDINGDGAVTTGDLLAYLTSFGWDIEGSGYNPLADLDNDGSVATSDLLILLGAFGSVLRSDIRGGAGVPAFVSATNAIISAAEPIIVYAVTPENVNGEAARGNYADVTLTFPGSNFELDIVNLDYEPTQLDHSR